MSPTAPLSIISTMFVIIFSHINNMYQVHRNVTCYIIYYDTAICMRICRLINRCAAVNADDLAGDKGSSRHAKKRHDGRNFMRFCESF